MTRTTMPKRIGALMLAIIMCLSLFPVSVFAEEPQAEPAQKQVETVVEQKESAPAPAQEATQPASEPDQQEAAPAAPMRQPMLSLLMMHRPRKAATQP